MNLNFTLIEKIMIFLIVIILITKFVDMHSNSQNKQMSPNTNTNVKVTDLGISVERFKQNFNANAKARNVPQLMLGDIEFGDDTKSDKNTFGYMFIRSFYLFGKINPDTGRVKNISITKALMFKDSNQKAEIQTAALAFLIVIQTLQPELTAQARSDIIYKFADPPKSYVEVIVGNIKYSQCLLENGTILMFSADVKL